MRPPSVVILFALRYPSFVEVIVEEFGFVGIPLSVEVIVVVPCLLCRDYVCWREELCTPSSVLPKSSVEVPCVESPVDVIVKILLR